jgi:hypothetical protein
MHWQLKKIEMRLFAPLKVSSSKPKTVVKCPANTPLSLTPSIHALIPKSKMAAAAAKHPENPSNLADEEICRWRFNELMDFKEKPHRLPADCVAYWESILSEAAALRDQHNAEAAALPGAYGYNTKEEGERIRKERDAITGRAYLQQRHYYDLRSRYSRELAYSIWWHKVEIAKAKRDAKKLAWDEACSAWWAEQDAFEQAQADAAVAALPEHLSDAKKKQLRALAKYRVFTVSRRYRRGGMRRVVRGLPLVQVGVHPYPAIPVYSAEERVIYNHAF